MNRTSRLRTGAIVAALHLLVVSPQGSPAAALAAAPARPDIVFIFGDDHAYDAVGSTGLTQVATPALDRLAARGTTFTHAYNMGSWSGAVCVPSRTMLMTGRHLWDARRIYDATDDERKAGRLWPQLLRAAGYETYFTGKWHVKADAARAFDVVRHLRPGMPGTVDAAYSRPPEGGPDPWSPHDRTLGGYWEGGTHWSEVVADDAVDFLQTAAPKETPFFLYVAFNAPHDPRQSPREYVEKYPPERVKVPASFLPEYPFKDSIGCGPGLRDEKLAPFPRTERSVRVHRGEYYALVSHLDAQVGRILEAIEASGRAATTWVFYTADHGLAVGHHGLFGKQNLYDHSVRVPFIAAGPGVPAGKRIAAPIYIQDAMPTCLELAGSRAPDHVWFRSILPAIRGEATAEVRDAIYGAYLDLQRAVSHEGYKLILYPRARRARLYRLADDPLEMRDLFGEAKPDGAKSVDVARRLFTRLRSLQEELGDTLDLAAVFPELR